MPEYLAPGVFVEEVSFRQRSIEGVSTSTTGFVGPTRFGPIVGEPPLLTSFGDFERIYGGIDPLDHGDLNDRNTNFLAQAVRAYFEEGGRRLYVARAWTALGGTVPAHLNADGHATWSSASTTPSDAIFDLRARYPGAAGNLTVSFRFQLAENSLDTSDPMNPELRGVGNFETVWASGGSVAAPGEVFWAERFFDEGLGRETFRLRRDDPGEPPSGEVMLDQVGSVQLLTVNVLVGPLGRFSEEQGWDDLTFHPEHPRSLFNVFAPPPTSRSTELFVPIIFASAAANGASLADAMLAQESLLQGESPPDSTVFDNLTNTTVGVEGRTFRVRLAGGNDGDLPLPVAYEGDDGGADGLKSGLNAFEDIEEISITATPGSGFDFSALGGTDQHDPIMRLLISHCERMRYRVAVLDSVNGQTPGEIQQLRGTIDSTRAALYYPWVRVLDPVTSREIHLPPSGFVTGIYARTDVARGVHKAPANEVVRLATGFELLLNRAQQEVLNPRGINCLRFFEGRGFRVWGARTASSDPEWKYLNVRRYFAFLERSIEIGTQWAVFEPNGPVLWSNVQRTVEDFLFNEWQSNHLLGLKPEEAFFVRCDRSTMSQNDIDNGRLICLVGVAPLRPAEFVIFRIGQKTADSR